MLDSSSLSQLKQLKKDIHDSTPRMCGEVKGTSKRFGFVISEDDGQQYLLPQDQMERVLPGDTIQFVLEKSKKENTKDDDKPIARIEKHLGSSFTQFIGNIKEKNNQLYVIPDHSQLNRWIFIPPKSRKGLKDGDLVSAKVTQHPFKAKGRVQAEVVAMIGQPDDPFIEHRYAVVKQGIDEKIWEPYEVEAVRQTAERTLEEEVVKKIDLRAELFVTIDGANTQDLDDALSVKKTDNGWQLMVAIADVATFVELGSPLDRIAAKQASTIYLPGQKISMLPEVLASEICSLKPNSDRLAMICTLSINNDGKITDTSYQNAVIHSKGKLSYDNVAQHLDGGDSTYSDEINALLTELNSLASTRNQWRNTNAVMTEDFSDFRFSLDDKGKITAIDRADRNSAQKLVEECMLACNQATAEFLATKQNNALFLSHKGFKPDQLPGVCKLLDAQEIAYDKENLNTLDEYLKIQRNIEVGNFELPLRDILRKKLTRSEWTTDCNAHFGLGFQCYTTFTSPIRKYSDLLNHRMIKSIIGNQPPATPDADTLAHVNTATMAVREAQKDCELSLKCQYLQDFKGKPLEGEISLINHRMISVYLKDFDVHGQIEVRSLEGNYTFKQDSLQLLSEGQNYALKQPISVTVTNIDLANRHIKLKVSD
ncbi:Exoribonuclease 2 [BD1-7 clade bacterium]|uniref:exoribonuclease II n=1 Tax=BD1-7 clade bacterium TaxID=2029982 RepID=A0A5S9QR68_9GAMM|nr:Exoribonuclease 2 [BD1-7 clade bacterium]CAA0120621.1 Exoribonuclease 2 [BD1-7 clade bacterium]